jgi:hypothetical protein
MTIGRSIKDILEEKVESLDTKVELSLVENSVRYILESSVFRSSKQCQVLLTYIVEHTLAHHDDLLRERVIGATVFGRTPDYDTGNDPVVRARVAEVRKRLAQYYLDHRDGSVVRISIPSGSYKAVFSSNDELHDAERDDDVLEKISKTDTISELKAAPEERKNKPVERRNFLHSWITLTALISFFAILGGGLALQHWRQEKRNHLFEQFWAPLTSSSKPVVLSIGSNYSFSLTSGYLESYRRDHHLQPVDTRSFLEGSKSSESIPIKALFPHANQIGHGDVAATARIAWTLAGFGKNYDLRYGNDISISDLHSSPAILIGGFSNRWTLQITRGLRYTLELGPRGSWILDHSDSSKKWQAPPEETVVPDDYAILSRLIHSDTGEFVLVIAGIGTSANQAVADFISDPVQINNLLRSAPKGWERMNMQVVLHTKTVNNVPMSVDVEAIHFW